MADDRLPALEEIRERAGRASRGSWAVQARSARDVPRLVAALDAVLKLHQPRQLYDMAESFKGEPLCAHGPDYDGDRHFEGDDGIWYCRDKPTVKVCGTCTDDGDPDLFSKWECPTVEAITRELTGEEHGNG